MEDELNDDGEIHEEFAEDDAFVGQRRDCSLPSFQVGCDVQKDFLVTLRLADEDTIYMDCLSFV